MFKKIKNNKAFTLVELLVIMAIIAVLVLLAIPKFMGYTEKAHLTEIKSNIKQLENASERYYIDKQEWPRLSDIPYTSDQLETFAQEIKDKTGAIVKLEEGGKYYSIDYNKLQKYVQKPKDNIHYILQNPVGEIYYLDKLTEMGQQWKSNNEKKNENEEDVTEDIIEDINKPTNVILHGLSPEVFDGEESTSYGFNSLKTITWDGDLNNREVTITAKAVYYNGNYPMYIRFVDANGNRLIPIGESNDNLILALNDTITTKKFIVPDSAVKMEIDMRNLYNYNGYLYEISPTENLTLPKPVFNVTHVSTDSSITLSWEQNETNYQKAAIYRDDKFLAYATGYTYVDKPLYANREYVYDIIAINSYGNASKKTNYKAKTDETNIVFHGLSPEAFDGDKNTYHTFNSLKTVTWDGDLRNKEISITAKAVYYNSNYPMYIRFIDVNGNRLIPIGESSDNIVLSLNNTITTKKFIVPDSAVKIEVDMKNLYNNNGYLYEISVTENLTLPKPVFNVMHVATDSSITLSWEQNEASYQKAAIYRDGKFLTYVTGYTYTDKPLYANSTHTYNIIAINSYGNASEITTHETITNKPDIVFHGLSPEAFDGDNNTSHAFNSLKTITWDGDLNNREITVIAKAVYYNGNYPMYIRFVDANGNRLTPIGESSNNIVLSPNNTITTKKIIVPDGSVKIEVDMKNLYNNNGYVYEISVTENLTLPKSVFNVTHVSTDSSITLSWEQNETNYQKVAIYRDGKFLTYVTSYTYTDKPLYANSTHVYDIIAINNYGNASKEVTYTTITNKPDIVFRGLSPEAFDGDKNTSHVFNSLKTITWDGDLRNKEISITAKAVYYNGNYPMYIRFIDANGNRLTPIGESSNNIVLSLNNTITTKKFIVPDNTVKIEVDMKNLYNNNGYIYEISVEK